MKKLILMLLVLTITQFPALAYNTQITLAGSQFGDNIHNVNEHIREYYNVYVSDYFYLESPHYPKDIIAPNAYGTYYLLDNDVGYRDYGFMLLDDNQPIKAGGYEVNYFQRYYIASEKNGRISENGDDLRLYAWSFSILPSNIDAVYFDLQEKLSVVYGEMNWSGVDKDIYAIFGEQDFFSNEYKRGRYSIWYADDDSSMIALTALDGNGYEWSPDEIIISYIYGGSDEWIDEMLELDNEIKQEETAREEEQKREDEINSIGDGNTSGL